MRFALKGDGLRKLNQLIERAKRISLNAVEESAVAVGEVAEDLAETGKATQKNPQGRKWRKTRDGQPLKWPARARLALVIRGTRMTLEVRGKAGEPYIAAQHSGASHRRGDAKWKSPARRIVPGRSLPKQWAEPIAAVLRISWREFLRGATKSVKAAKRRKKR